MPTSLLLAALLMGLAGSPHCAAMCGPACAAITRTQTVQWRPNRAMQGFQFGRLLGYAAAGAVVGGAVQAFAWLSAQTAALKPAWTLFHLLVLAWGLSMVLLARQPAWVDQFGRAVWHRLRPLAEARGGMFMTGSLWALMPCGLLYSALLMASLAGGAWQGALVMGVFAATSSLSLMAAPALLLRLRERGNALRQDVGTRLAGALLVLVAGWGLWMDVFHRIAVWCGLA